MSGRVEIVQPGPLSLTALGIRARLEEVFPPRLFTHEWMPGRVDRDVWQKLTRRVPLVGIGFNSFSPAAHSQAIGGSEWTVYLATRNESGLPGSLFGDRLAPGLFGVLEVGAAALHGHAIPGAGSITLKAATHAVIEDFKDDGLELAVLDLLIPTDISLMEVLRGGVAEPGDLNSQDIDWGFDETSTLTGSHP